MKTNPVKRVLADGGIALGTMVFEFATSGIARIVARSGADFVIFDMEHTGWSTETLRSLFATCGGTDLVAMARVPAAQYHLIARALDVGAMGIMVPMVESEAQARLVAQSAKVSARSGGAAPRSASHTTTIPAATWPRKSAPPTRRAC